MYGTLMTEVPEATNSLASTTSMVREVPMVVVEAASTVTLS